MSKGKSKGRTKKYDFTKLYNAVLVNSPPPSTLINSKTKTATKAPMGSIKIPSHFKL